MVVVLSGFAPVTARAQDDHKEILVLHSTRRDAQFSDVAERGLTRILDAGLQRNVDYYSEFIDVSRFPEASYQAAFHDFMRLKYQNVRFDLVIALHDVAIAFVTAYRDTLFHDTPAVFLTTSPSTTRFSNSTGLIHERDFLATPALIRQLQPDVRQVFVVTGAAVADVAFENAVRRQLTSSNLGLTFTYLSGLATPDLEDRLSRLPERSAVYHVLVSEDGAGDKFHPLEYVDRVAAAANAPTYSWVDSAMDHGIVGGSLYTQAGAIHRVGQLALRVLRGEPAESIPITALNLNRNQLDWRQLRRWGIDEGRVPQGTLVQFRNPTLWDRYRTYIVAALMVLFTQTVLIAGLLIQRNRRRRAEEELRGSQKELLRSYERNRDLGTRLLRAQENERSRIARELHDDICQRMLLLTIELESLRRSHSGEKAAADALTVARDISKSLHELSHQLHPARLRMIGLVPALDHLCRELSRAGIRIAFAHECVPSRTPADVMLCFFRVVQEALQNAIKYSNATDVVVELRGCSDRLSLTVVDNGVGFDIDTAWGKGVGLVSMVERLDAMHGSFDIASTLGVGTRLTATIPFRDLPENTDEMLRSSSLPAGRVLTDEDSSSRITRDSTATAQFTHQSTHQT
jgi:signal transduction histidine kinase